MAAKTAETHGWNEDGIFIADFGSIPDGDTATFKVPRGNRVTVQRYAGTGTVAVTGSMDGTTFGAVHRVDGTTDVSLADAEPVMVLEKPLFLRAAASGAVASVMFTVS